MEYMLLVAIAFIPFIISISLIIYSRSTVSVALACFLVLLGAWQLEIASLYADGLLSEQVIDRLFRIFRVGPILIMPIIYYFIYYLVSEHEELRRYRKWINRTSLSVMIGYSILVYIINFTEYGVTSYMVAPGRVYSPTHWLPVYGSLNWTFLLNIFLVFIHTFLLLRVTILMKDPIYKLFYGKLIIGALFVFLNGVTSGFGLFPLFFSSFNSILVAILLFIGFFQMQTARVKQANTRLAKQSELLEAIMNLNPNYLIVMNQSNQIIKVNDSAEKLWDVDKTELTGKDFSVLAEPPYSINPLRKDVQRFVNKTGRPYYIQWGFQKLDQAEKEYHTLFYGIDFSKQKENERLLLSSEKSKVIGELAASIAHEIRNPLTTVRGFIQLSKEVQKENGYEDIVLEEIDRINEVLKELLLLAKPEAQVEDTGDSSTSISVVHEVNTIKLLFEAIAMEQNKSISIHNTLDHGHLVRFEKSHFKQVIINILKNSFEALPKMGKIKIKIDEKSGKTRIRILDNGRGIARERLSRIGEPYYTNKEKGTGIGLTICFKLIADYSGQMKVKSKIGWGTVVTITLDPVPMESRPPKEELDGRSTVV
ncbi:ATP-binding protein [Rossellomorea marisflavi]|uniref:histidine kinase n=1 Tax=Rossellomorea marisflavi TaxID=189381 RepID=A0A165J3Y7_9BACI|nr:ATP-binding protein [Rossellomorea marisflavi]KZE45224.1 hypothetical protein AV649_03230 [Rossellomorea marisflavi]QHA36356.1 two-component sensor histidine kinase [Rossellomorea marisflavi]TYO72536.1 two-component sensor histidine kinase [Rossellomorea marisflavi]USK94310.1 two-component sensor histidine kinase [Rossellomorea marisflavi]